MNVLLWYKENRESSTDMNSRTTNITVRET